MKKILKIFFIFLISFIAIGFTKSVKANSISKISMDIYVNSVGNATVTEVWTCNVNQGTEVYHPYYNLGNSQIKDLTVTEKGKAYETLSTWNTSGTLSSKAYKCGINKISNGIELCWGITEYGSHVYTVKYTITNFVSSLYDSQMIYWTLIPYEFSNSIGAAYIKIHTDFNILDSVGVWGYGNYGGTAYVYDGYIEMQSDGRLDTDEYMTILVKFPEGTFQTTNTLDHDFDYYLNMANEGATVYREDDKMSIFEVIMKTILPQIAILGTIIAAIIYSKNNSSNGGLRFGVEGKKIPKDVAYYRDIPCKENVYRAYYIGYQYGLLKNKTDLLGAIILKWVKESKVKIELKEEGKIFKKENAAINLRETDPESITNDKERLMFKMLYEASNDGVLESKEFEKWCKKNYTRVLGWFDGVLEKERDKLVSEGLINETEKTTLKVFKNKVYEATPKLKQEALQLAGLKRYLKEYTLIKDRQAIEVHLFEDYLVFAQIMGIAKQVAKEFKDLYPEVIEESSFTSYDNIMFINAYAASGITSANTAKARAESYSSGGGGFSSGGGGGGSFGGGGGGGGFR